MRTLEGRRVALLEGRKSGELAGMVSRLGGVATTAPAVREMARPDDFDPLLRRIIRRDFAIVVVLSGAGITALFQEADARGRLVEIREALASMTLAVRGPKPLAALKPHRLSAHIMTGKPHTSDDLLEALALTPLDGVPLLVLHYGERNEAFAGALRSRGAVVDDVCLYEWALPEDTAPLRALIDATVGRRIDAILFTSQVQFRHLVRVAEDMRCADAVLQALSRDVIVGAVGPVCASALRQGGLVPDVIPALPNSVSLVNALADYFMLTDSGKDLP